MFRVGEPALPGVDLDVSADHAVEVFLTTYRATAPQ